MRTVSGKKSSAHVPDRLADAEDVSALRKAKHAEGKASGIPLAEAKRTLGLQ
jgi:hypothetical protein